MTPRKLLFRSWNRLFVLSCPFCPGSCAVLVQIKFWRSDTFGKFSAFWLNCLQFLGKEKTEKFASNRQKAFRQGSKAEGVMSMDQSIAKRCFLTAQLQQYCTSNARAQGLSHHQIRILNCGSCCPLQLVRDELLSLVLRWVAVRYGTWTSTY